MSKTFLIEDPYLHSELNLFIGKYEDFKTLMAKNKLEFDEAPNARGISGYDEKQHVYWMYLESFSIESFNTFVHELTHHCIANFAHKNIQISERDHEAFAYYMDMMTNLIIKKVMPKKVKISSKDLNQPPF